MRQHPQSNLRQRTDHHSVRGVLPASYQTDPRLCDRVFSLLEPTFPGVGRSRHNAEAFGARWEDVSTPFVVEHQGRVVCHVGLMPMPLWALGSPLRCGGVHGVATEPGFRRRGLFRAAMESLLDVAGSRFETLILTTLHREYFEPFGFRVVPESVFRYRTSVVPPATESRILDFRRPSDLSLMHRLLEERTPTSDVMGVGVEKAGWAFYEYESLIRYLPDRDVAVIARQDGDTLRLYDVIGRSIPPIAAVVAAFSDPIREVVAYLSPDRLGGGFVPEPHDLTGGPDALEPGTADFVLMVRGPFPAEGRPLMLPRPARC